MTDNRTMRDTCIALEAVLICTRAIATESRITGEEIAEQAIAKVQAECDAGRLGILYYSWTEDHDKGS